MISGHKVGAGQIDYYLDYVRQGGPSRWVGAGAAELGLSGAVDPADFATLAAGSRPDGTRLLERVPPDRTPGWDFTFSVPKSVSVCWALADADLRRGLEAAHDGALEAAVGFLESVGGRARRGLGGRDGHVPADLAVACFTHPASRESDPQLHSHAIVLNVGHGADGRWTAIDSRTLYLHRRAAAAVYRVELRARVAALGGVWSAADQRGLSELVGVERETLRAFSRRRQQIEQTLAGWGGSGREASQAACLVTRRAKLGAELSELSDEWRTRAAGLGWDARRVSGLLDGIDRRSHLDAPGAARIEDRLLSRTGLTREAAAFTRDDVVVAWADALPQGADRSDLEARVTATLARDEVVDLVVADAEGSPLTTSNRHRRGVVRLVRSVSGSGTLVAEPRYSTTEMLGIEAGLFHAAESGRGSGAGRCRDATVAAVLSARPHLSDEQTDMVGRICTSGDRVDVAVGVPGSGKTFALEAARAAWTAAGYRVVGAALAAEAAAQLQAGSGIASSTLDSLLARIGAEGLAAATVVVVDEAGLVDTRRLARLVDAAATAGAKVVLTGDDRQLPAVEAGGAFAALARRLDAARLSDNGRQVADWERRALVALREGRSGEAAGAYARAGRVHHSDTPADLLSQMVERWWSARQGGEEAALFAYSRDATRLLNAMARHRLEADGRLAGPEVAVAEQAGLDLAERAYRCGDEIVCLRNRRLLGAARDPSGLGVRNGTRGVVTGLDPGTGEITIATPEGAELRLPGDYVARYTDYGYALTLHKGQGRTVGQAARAAAGAAERRAGRAFVYGAESLSAEAALVAASRATDSTELFVLTETDAPLEEVTEDLARTWARSAAKTTATDELEQAALIATLADGDPHGLLRRRDELAAVIGAGPKADPVGDVGRANHLLGLVALELEHTRADDRAMHADTDSPSFADASAGLARLRAEIDQAVVDALAQADAADAGLQAHRSRQERFGSDLRSAWQQIEAVDSALATRRVRRLDELAVDPPDYVVGLLGPPPREPVRALRWRQGLTEIEDYRRNRLFRQAKADGPALVVAIGDPPEDWWDARRYRRVAASLTEVRRDVGVEPGQLRAVSGDTRGGAAAAVLQHCTPAPPAPTTAAPAHARRAQRHR